MDPMIELEPEVVAAIRSGHKIEAIKKLREVRGLGLKEAKDLVDLYCSQNNIESVSTSGSTASLGLVILISVIGFLLYQFIF
ncbi:ribosomal protein L7/L12 [Shewanella baltica]|uniref:ribosomal protein L7/L12 n=1 Tax=Shewanella baltica TaxID=62322 RepID=UPI0024BB1D9D|nr:ribosomal protein L7/L12 [Shewanella baltica]